jgi:hypothetical protein
MNPNVNYGLWVIVICQGKFIDRNKMYHLGGRVLIVGEAVHVLE